MQEETTQSSFDRRDESLLTEIREKYKYYSERWRESRDERKTDVRYLCGDPWDPADRKARADAGRPCISHDELNQYVNEVVNAARQSKRGIKIEPAGNGATDKTAELRQDIARTIEYRSRAQSIYLKAYQDEVEGGYGFCRVSRRYLNDDTDEQEIVVKPIPNPDSVLYDPDCKEPDWSDATGCFVLNPIPLKEFKRLYPDAQTTSFTTEDREAAPEWITNETVLVAEYWKLEISAGKGKSGRKVQKKKVVQYITNGVEILDRTEEPGTEISIIPFIGMERYVDEGSGPQRKLFSLVRFARDPQMSLAYLCTLELEEGGLTPKSPYMGYVGQFETDAVAWQNLTKQPVGFIQVDPVVDAVTNQVLPLPQRIQFTPNFGAYEVAKESCRRAIQAAMGINPLPTAAQRQNEKSGVALQKIQQQQEIGSFHFVDGFDRAVTRVGRIINSWIPVVYDTEREIGLHRPDESRRVVRLGGDPDPDGNTYDIGEGDHDVTVGTGPSASSQHDAVDDFLDLLVGELKNLPIPPPAQAKLLSLSIQMKQLGPKGDEMAEIISPSQNQPLPPQAQQAVSQLQQQAQQMHAYAQQLEQKVQELEFEKQAKVADNQAKYAIEKMRLENDLARAEVTTKAQSMEERMKFVEDMYQQLHSQAHDVAMQAHDQVHQQGMAQQQQDAASQQQEQQPQQLQQ